MTNEKPEKMVLARAGNMDDSPQCNHLRSLTANAGIVAGMGMGSL